MAVKNKVNVLALSPHADDAELGAGGYLARIRDEDAGARITVVAFSTGHPRNGASRDEFEAAMSVIGASSYELLDFCDRYFPMQRQAILDHLIRFKRALKPDLVLIPATTDVNQDHQVVSSEAVRLFKKESCILGYDLPWNNVLGRDTRLFVKLEQEHVDRKLSAVACYRSQDVRTYTSPEALLACVGMGGMQVGTKYAEAFEVIRWIY